MKCIVKNCQNHTHQGKFVGDLCLPCYEFATGGEGRYSQLYRNTVEAEREAIIARNAPELEKANAYIRELEDRIRARGEKK